VTGPIPNERIKALRHARGWTQREAANAVASIVSADTGRGHPTGIDAQWIGRLERGERRWPNADYRAALRTAYRVRTDAELGLTGIRERYALDNEARIGAPAADTAPIESATYRPETTLLTAAQEAADFASWAERVNTGDVTIISLNMRARELAATALTMPPAQVASDAAALNRETFTLLKGHHKPRHARDLYAIAAQTCALLAWLSGDLGALDAATLQGSAAQVCADHADHPEVSAWVAVVRSKTAFWRGDYLTAAQLAWQGASYSPPGTAAVMLACQEADAYSKLGVVDRAAEALRRADKAAEAIHGADTIGGLFSCEPARHANYASGSHLLAGRPDLALVEAGRALTEISSDSRYGFGTIGQVHITRTLAFISHGDLDGATEAVRPVLDLPEERRLATLKDRLRSAISSLGRPAVRDSAVAAPLRAEITEFCGTSSAQRQLTTGTHEGR
jgi:transcriptional regulator with XRE-family HTH domain